MEKESNVEVIRKLYKAWSPESPDPEMFSKLLDEYLDPDAVVVETESLPYAGLWHGRKGFDDLCAKVLDSFKDFMVSPEEIIDAGDYVIALCACSGKNKKTGKAFRTSIAEIWKFKDGKVIQVRPFYLDTHAMLV